MTIEDVISRINADKDVLGITLYDGATYNDIKWFEQFQNLMLPNEVKIFYSFCNGFESEEDMFRIIPLSEAAEHVNNLKANQYYIAEYMIYCDAWILEFDQENPENYSIVSVRRNGEYLTLTHSFIEFLTYFLNGGVFEENGLYEWAAKKEG